MDRPAGPASSQIARGVAITVSLLLRIDEPDWALIRGADYFGIALLATSPGSPEYALEEGPRGNWLEDQTITAAARLLQPQVSNGELRRSPAAATKTTCPP